MHKSVVFLSCGQRDSERELAKRVKSMIEDTLDMYCYNADCVHGFDDVMSITKKLAMADYYIMVDFRRRGRFCRRGKVPLSVFTHQELALAHAWGLDRMLVFQEEGLTSHGILKYVLAHPIPFTRDSLVDTIQEAIYNQEWEPSYSRNLVALGIQPFNERKAICYIDHTGKYLEHIWHLTICNRRKYKAAVNTIAVLNSIRNCRTEKTLDLPDRSYLKWAYQKEGYLHTILPKNCAPLDAFALRASGENGLFLHSRRDYYDRKPVVSEFGEYKFTYNIYSANFPLLSADVRINYSGPGPLQVKAEVDDMAIQAMLETG